MFFIGEGGNFIPQCSNRDEPIPNVLVDETSAIVILICPRLPRCHPIMLQPPISTSTIPGCTAPSQVGKSHAIQIVRIQESSPPANRAWHYITLNSFERERLSFHESVEA